jgi:hypothetical protein
MMILIVQKYILNVATFPVSPILAVLFASSYNFSLRIPTQSGSMILEPATKLQLYHVVNFQEIQRIVDSFYNFKSTLDAFIFK